MNRLAISRNEVDYIFLTHFHADHVGGVPFFILEANYIVKRDRPLTIVGPPSLKARYPQIMETGFPGTKAMELRFPLMLREVEIGRRDEFGPLRLTAYHVVHDDRAGPCLGLRLEAEGKVIAFSGGYFGRGGGVIGLNGKATFRSSVSSRAVAPSTMRRTPSRRSRRARQMRSRC